MKYNHLNKHYGILIMVSLSMISACKKSFLDVEPQGQISVKNFWKTNDDAIAAVNAVYGNLRSAGQVGIASVAIESLGSDDADPGAKQSDIPEMYQFDNFSVTSSNQFIGSFGLDYTQKSICVIRCWITLIPCQLLIAA